MLSHYINKYTLIYPPHSSGVYQYEYESWDIRQDTNKVFVLETKQKNCWTCSVCYSCNNQLMKNIPPNSQKGDGCSGLIVLIQIQKLMDEPSLQVGYLIYIFKLVNMCK